MRIGIDLGGTKTEVIALSEQGEQLFRHRLPTPRDDYHQTIEIGRASCRERVSDLV